MYGCIHKSNKEKVVQSLAVVGFGVPEPKIIVDDTQQLLYMVELLQIYIFVAMPVRTIDSRQSDNPCV